MVQQRRSRARTLLSPLGPFDAALAGATSLAVCDAADRDRVRIQPTRLARGRGRTPADLELLLQRFEPHVMRDLREISRARANQVHRCS
jgi:hypothetical protein